jgi:hypothetical protein
MSGYFRSPLTLAAAMLAGMVIAALFVPAPAEVSGYANRRLLTFLIGGAMAGAVAYACVNVIRKNRLE